VMETDLQTFPVCPHCGHEHDSAFEWTEDDGEHECDSCSKPFSYERVVDVSYTTKAQS
jgi:transcription elongation factor Elf1